MGISQCNDMDRVWDTPKYHPKVSVSIFKVIRSFKVTKSMKDQTENFSCGSRGTYF